MPFHSKLPLILTVGLLASVSPSDASFGPSLYAGFFMDQNGLKVAPGTLFQLVDLGPNGIFDSINLSDGSVSGLEKWVSGDDSVITASYLEDPQFTTMAAFDLQRGPDNMNGIFDRQLKFNSTAVGKFGLRWFPGLQADQFNASMSLEGQFYGEFTRQDDPLVNGVMYDGARNSGSLWVFTDGTEPNLDNLRTLSAGGPDPDSLGRATNFIPAPEPSSALLAALGLTGLLSRRRRRA